MKASELVKELNKLIDKYGDREVAAFNGEGELISTTHVSLECDELPVYTPKYLEDEGSFLIMGDSIY